MAGKPKYICVEERLTVNSVVEYAGYVTPCWIWIGARNNSGYGRISFWDKSRKKVSKRTAHSVAGELMHGKPPDGQEWGHKCGNRACINPEHLEHVTRRANIWERDDRAKLRARSVVGQGALFA
jgi:hypothetical protein